MEIIKFLEARIAEDEAWARQEDEDYAGTTLLPTYDSDHQANWNTARVLAECAAKRAILGEHGIVTKFNYELGAQEGCELCNWERDYGWDETGPCKTLRALVAVYKDHPDYNPDWQ